MEDLSVEPDVDLSQLEGRLAHQAARRRLLFWEDETGEYREALPQLQVPGTTVLDITGHELAAKRRVLRDEPHARFVLYRAGGAPPVGFDFVLDLKLQALPFSCSRAALWAEECGIGPLLVPQLEEHAAFFASKERRRALKATSLPVGTQSQLELALVAATLGVRDANPRDAVRSMAARLLVEWARGDEASLRALEAASLSQALWQACATYLGYTVPKGAAPSTADLAFRLLEGAAADVVADDHLPSAAESVHVMQALSTGARTRPAFEHVANAFGKSVWDRIPTGEAAPARETLAGVDFLRQVDQALLLGLAKDLSTTGLDERALEEVRGRRVGTAWYETYQPCYEALLALARFRTRLAEATVGMTGAATQGALFKGYVGAWYQVDAQYRAFHTAWRQVGWNPLRQALQTAVDSLEGSYRTFLTTLATAWQAHLLDDGPWPPQGLPRQRRFFSECVLQDAPNVSEGRRVGVVVSDALRYEQGRELAQQLSAAPLGRARMQAECEAMLCMLPSYTQLGMAALLPEGPLSIDEDTGFVALAGSPTQGLANRQATLQARLPGSLALKAEDVLADGLPNVSAAPVVYVFHNVIDKVGDNAETERKVFTETAGALDEIKSLVRALLNAGCHRVFVTSDHGFIYQDAAPGEADHVDDDVLPLSGGPALRNRRFVVGQDLPTSDVTTVYQASQLGLEGGFEVLMPRGIMRLRLKGSGERFVHGGVTLQENVVPLVQVRRVANKEAAHSSDVSLHAMGQHLITGSSIGVKVCQEEPCGPGVLPSQAKVGVYAPDGRLVSSREEQVQLDSQAPSAQERIYRVDLELTNDVDAYQKVQVRVLVKDALTNGYKEADSITYDVNRAFGSDFDF